MLVERNRFLYVVIEFQLRNSSYGEERARLRARQHVELIEALLASESERALAVLRAHLEAVLTTLRSLAQTGASGTQVNGIVPGGKSMDS
jgi:DNA-binding GntR family transcriptional regulator